MTMIEKVARAIWDYNECSEAGLQWDCEPGTISDLQKHMAIDCARKCIEAIAKEPSDQMCWQMNSYLNCMPGDMMGKQAIQDVLGWALLS